MHTSDRLHSNVKKSWLGRSSDFSLVKMLPNQSCWGGGGEGGRGGGPLLLLGQLKTDSLVALMKKIFFILSPKMTLKKHTKSSKFVSFFVAVSFYNI
jgi:hypothetical protein